MRRLRLLVLLPAALLPLTWVAPVSADIGGLAVAPTHIDPNNPATRAYFILTVPPGGSITDQVRVGNTGAKTLQVIVSAVDGLTGQTSGAVYANREDPVLKAGRWVTVAAPAMAVPAQTSTMLNFTVRVPAGAVPGDHLAGIAFEDAHPQTTGTGIQVTTVLRAVVGVLIKVPGPAAVHITVETASIGPFTPQSPTSTVFVDILNDGRLLDKPKLTIDLRGPNGYHASHTRQLDTILPGDEIHYPFAWPDSLRAGQYTVTVTADSSTLTKTVDLDRNLVDPTPTASPAPVVAGTPTGASTPLQWLVPVAAGLVVLNGVCVGTIVLLLRRRGRRRDPARRLGRPGQVADSPE